ncbi:hypothetical protein [Stackebrandtia nassauensis]|uniref:Uncharacterized protein n=1 Tax=Stackebrandtia nassauensis (strain DSM 44728 / CIP 108903 / NRRL B-16338 / NBRC 102104 / LLR-40K-21) TaxID=446470 RepID=D3Q962_STANL|nr:hypothetical protein [Stackebrandtia nassauensis]ADD40671.1 hypothetical protein Snas_0961 [Stackebrandtia nassauensis DSM 44728]
MTTEPTATPAGAEILTAIGAEPDPQRREHVQRVLSDHRDRRDPAAEAAMRERLGLPPASQRTAA